MTTVAIHRSLDALEAAVGMHMDRAAQPGLHDRLDWFRFLLRYTPPAAKPAFLRVQSETGGLVLPLSLGGARAQALANWYTLAWRPVTWGDSAGLIALAAASLRRVGTLVLDPVDAEQAAALAGAFGRAGWRVENRPGKAHWVAHVAGRTFQDFWAARPSKLRNTVARKRKKAGLETRILSDFEPQGWAAYEDVYAHSWKPEEGSMPFLRSLADSEGAAGTLRLGLAFLGELPVAGQVWLVENGVATIHKLAYREDKRDLSPGSILSAAMFEHVLNHDRPVRISYGLGDEPYKADWMDERHEMRLLILRNPRHPLGAASLARAALARLVKPVRSR